MDQPELYYSSDNVFAEILVTGNGITQPWPSPVWILDLVYSGEVEFNSVALVSAGFWRLSHNHSFARSIRAGKGGHGEFLSIGLHENTYADRIFPEAEVTGAITTAMTYSIIKIVSSLKHDREKFGKNIWINCYVQLLINQLDISILSKRNYSCGEYKSVFYSISSLTKISDAFPSPRELARQTGMSQSRFQKICLELYGQSAQKIIQHLKMRQACSAILKDRKTISKTSSELGYRHSPNFITAFRNHFCITPMEAVQYTAK